MTIPAVLETPSTSPKATEHRTLSEGSDGYGGCCLHTQMSHQWWQFFSVTQTNKKQSPESLCPGHPPQCVPSCSLISVIHTYTAPWKSRNTELNPSFLLRLNHFWFLGPTAWARQGQPLSHSAHWITVRMAASLEPWFSINPVCPAGSICQL